MDFKKKIALLLSIVTIIVSLSTAAFAGPIHAPPSPIRDSIVEKF
ncbi:hypothetical protein [Tepidimicrobium xylanilyticum]|uniref:Cyclic lactone autoinducer peptide n=1 Tax=Tepidimicrobium xylanilyticum TaxID=1123352 RepID=A0A1H2TW95_9FIRM|nr:hypothetical protein [Tepidimicrobium xylanilyticum]GMG98039.1 hypothetical protein EN5CB1_28650 [Tepidimicrobium xylanilyticum]SDW48183.1 hypothetical protein SAMN05660923_00827 [Tepidimicrobium xylanilyticum]